MNQTLNEIVAKTIAEDGELKNKIEEISQLSPEEFSLTCESLWGLPVPPVAVLRTNGVKIKVEHSRWVKGRGIHKTKEFIARGFSGKDFEPRAGATEVTIAFPDGETRKGKSVCVKNDNWARKSGLYIAMEKALF